MVKPHWPIISPVFFENDGIQANPVVSVSIKLPVKPILNFLITERALVGVHNLAVLKYFAQVTKVVLRHLSEKQSSGFYKRIVTFYGITSKACNYAKALYEYIKMNIFSNRVS